MDNSNKVKWDSRINPPTITDIRNVEEFFDVKFPQDYILCVLENHGGKPYPNRLDIGSNDATSFGELLTFDPTSKIYIPEKYNRISEELPDGIIPFANDPGGNYICFDYKNGKQDEPIIVFWDHELSVSEDDLSEEELEEKSLEEYQREAIVPICSTFTELLSKLYTK
ncbi:SMI1/KNR4 family protein [Brevibacillus sp. SYSU BS000544]|uniref:SMI1/KNR4 family protein n=1 Tax=Brevibacillus sp. SYSU BS000544 TaxID=3416443 RepID=UPI003CE4BF1F